MLDMILYSHTIARYYFFKNTGDFMAIAVIRRETESNEKLIARWKKKAQQAGIVQEFRKKMRFSKKMNKTKEKAAAIVREKFRSERAKNQFYS